MRHKGIYIKAALSKPTFTVPEAVSWPKCVAAVFPYGRYHWSCDPVAVRDGHGMTELLGGPVYIACSAVWFFDSNQTGTRSITITNPSKLGTPQTDQWSEPKICFGFEVEDLFFAQRCQSTKNSGLEVLAKTIRREVLRTIFFGNTRTIVSMGELC